MKGWTGLFLGILGTFAFSWIGLALVPTLQLGHLEPQSEEEGTDIYPVPRSGMAERGRQVYIANGCNYCHTQQVRADWVASDISRKWGTRRSAPRDYIFDRPALIGRMRTGPDLANIGKRPAPETAPAPAPGATDSTTSGAPVPAPPGGASPAAAGASPPAAGSPAAGSPAAAGASPPADAAGTSPAPAAAAASPAAGNLPVAGTTPGAAASATPPGAAASPPPAGASPPAVAAKAVSPAPPVPPPTAPASASAAAGSSPAAPAQGSTSTTAAATAPPGPSVVPPSGTSSGPPALSAAAQAPDGAPVPADPAQVTDIVGGEPLLYTAAWHHRHLYSPRSIVPDSIMPAFRFLYRKQRIGGEPSNNALVLARGDRPEPGWEVVPTYDAECLVAYLMSLDQSHGLNEAKGAAAAAPAASPATSPAPADQAPAPGK